MRPGRLLAWGHAAQLLGARYWLFTKPGRLFTMPGIAAQVSGSLCTLWFRWGLDAISVPWAVHWARGEFLVPVCAPRSWPGAVGMAPAAKFATGVGSVTWCPDVATRCGTGGMRRRRDLEQ